MAFLVLHPPKHFIAPNFDPNKPCQLQDIRKTDSSNFISIFLHPKPCMPSDSAVFIPNIPIGCFLNPYSSALQTETARRKNEIIIYSDAQENLDIQWKQVPATKDQVQSVCENIIENSKLISKKETVLIRNEILLDLVKQFKSSGIPLSKIGEGLSFGIINTDALENGNLDVKSFAPVVVTPGFSHSPQTATVASSYFDFEEKIRNASFGLLSSSATPIKGFYFTNCGFGITPLQGSDSFNYFISQLVPEKSFIMVLDLFKSSLGPVCVEFYLVTNENSLFPLQFQIIHQ